MQSKESQNFKVRYSIDKDAVAITFHHMMDFYHTIILDNLSELRELGDLITAVRGDILEQPLGEA